MLLNVFISALLMVITTMLHASGMVFAMHEFRDSSQGVAKGWRQFRAMQVGAIVLLMFFVSLLEALLWAFAYLALNAIEGLEPAVYFSMVTFTTLGYGDVLLDEQWRLLASFEAANGIIMFGWTTAIVIAFVQRLYFRQRT